MSKRQIFSSALASVIVLIGMAIGLGNVWRFPYMMGQYGGSAFLLVYLGFTLLFAIPALTGEMALGRMTRKGPIGAFTDSLGPLAGKLIGALIIITIIVATSYYVVVIGNVLYTCWISITKGFAPEHLPEMQKQLGNASLQFSIVAFCLLAGSYVIYRGLNKGIEPLSKIFVPFFLIAIVYLIINAMLLEGATDKMLAFIKPDFGAIGPDQAFAALGQTFFSIGLGGNFVLIYGSYLQKEKSIPQLATFTALGDVSASLLAGLFVVPTVLVFGLDMQSGPGLLFETMPQLFHAMPGGRFMGSLFLFALSMVAFLSLIAALEVILASFLDIERFKPHRNKFAWISGALVGIIALPSTINPELIGILDLIFGSGMMIFGSTLTILGFVWGWKKSAVLKEVFGENQPKWKALYYFWIKWIVPIALLAVLIGYIYNL